MRVKSALLHLGVASIVTFAPTQLVDLANQVALIDAKFVSTFSSLALLAQIGAGLSALKGLLKI